MSDSLTALLRSLHVETVEALLKKVRSGEATAADLNVARAMLRDNGIEAVAAPGSPIKSLTDALPYPGQDDSEPTYQ